MEFNQEVWTDGLGTAGAALGSNLSFGLWDGGKYKNYPGFDESQFAWGVAEFAITGGVGAAKAAARKAGQEVVYYGMKNGQVAYVGRTNNLARRGVEHGTRFDSLVQITKKVSRDEARLIEQAAIEKYGMKKAGGILQNKRNEIAKTRSLYQRIDKYRGRVK